MASAGPCSAFARFLYRQHLNISENTEEKNNSLSCPLGTEGTLRIHFWRVKSPFTPCSCFRKKAQGVNSGLKHALIIHFGFFVKQISRVTLFSRLILGFFQLKQNGL